MTLLSCHCDIQANALTMCKDHYAWFKKTYTVHYPQNDDQRKISEKKFAKFVSIFGKK